MPPVESAGPDRHPSGGRQPHPPRQHRAGESCGGADLPAPVENPQRLRPAERPGPTRLPTTGTVTYMILRTITNTKRRLTEHFHCFCNKEFSEQDVLL